MPTDLRAIENDFRRHSRTLKLDQFRYRMMTPNEARAEIRRMEKAIEAIQAELDIKYA